MNILILTPQLPYPPRQGTALRNWGIIQGLAERHRVCLLSLSDSDDPHAVSPVLHETCAEVIAITAPTRRMWDRLRRLASRTPDLAWRRRSQTFLDELVRWIGREKFDVVQTEGLELGVALSSLRAHVRVPPPLLVYDAHNAEQLIQARALATDGRRPARWPAAAYSWLQLPRIQAFEAAVLQLADRVTCVSTEDGSALAGLVPGARPVVIPNGLSVDEYSTGRWDRPQGLGPMPIVFTGKMDYRPNVDAAEWFARDIWPAIRHRRPEAQFAIVGQAPTARVSRLGREPGVVVTGAVEDVRPYLAHAAALVAPLRMGGGTRFKLLQAMAMGTPVVATRVGAEGIASQSGRELLLADTPGEFVDAVLRLMHDSALRAELASAGQTLVRAHYDWKAIIPTLESVYAPMARAADAPPAA